MIVAALSRLRHRQSCDFETLRLLAQAVGARLGVLEVQRPGGWSAVPCDLPDSSVLEVRLLAALDLAVSKIGRFSSQDRDDIATLARHKLIRSAVLRRRTEEALGGYVGETTRVQGSIELAVREQRRPPRALVLVLSGSSTSMLESLNTGAASLYDRFAWHEQLRPLEPSGWRHSVRCAIVRWPTEVIAAWFFDFPSYRRLSFQDARKSGIRCARPT